MPQYGIGIIPGGTAAGQPGFEAGQVIRRAFVPKLIVQTRLATPTLAAFWGNAKPAHGGVSSITVPMQGGAMVTTASSDFSGRFAQPAALNPIVDGEWNLKVIVTPIAQLGMEALIEWDAAIVPRLQARMNDAGNSQAEYYSTQFWTNATYGSQDIDGLPLIVNNTGTYAGLSRSANSWLQANLINAGAVDPTRPLLMQYLTSQAKFNAGEAADIGFTGPGTWSRLAKDFLGLEQYMLTPGSSFDRSRTEGPRSGFWALMVGGIPIYPDHSFGTEGSIYLTKRKYTSMYVHQAAAFAFTGFSSTLVNLQLGYIGALVTVAEMVCVRPKAWTVISGLNYDTV